ncbi:hypothetical protein [Peribacillus simplex]|uniref:hypothetical protein n=1 Tax=Peribacillus simplex TaxID=1478 RepID=UPI003D2B8246
MLTDEGGTATAGGLGVLEDEYIGLYNIITHENFRNQGNGQYSFVIYCIGVKKMEQKMIIFRW